MSELHTATKLNVRFSVTIRQDRKVRARIQGNPGTARASIPYWLSTPEVSGADVAEVSFPAGNLYEPVRLQRDALLSRSPVV